MKARSRFYTRAAGTLVLAVLLLAACLGTGTLFASAEEREVLFEDDYETGDFSKAYANENLMVYANSNASFAKDHLMMLVHPAATGSVTYDVSELSFPLVQVEFDFAFYAAPASVLQYFAFYTSEDGTAFTKTSIKLLEEPAEMTDAGLGGWFMCKVVNFAAIREGTNYLKIEMTTPGQFWDIQAYRTTFYAAEAGDINLIAPTIALSGQYDNVIAKDTMVDILPATATDDVTPSSELTVSVVVKSPLDSIVTVTDNQFVLGMYGDYKIIYTTLDEHGNEGELVVTIESKDKDEMNQSCNTAQASTLGLLLLAAAALSWKKFIG